MKKKGKITVPPFSSNFLRYFLLSLQEVKVGFRPSVAEDGLVDVDVVFDQWEPVARYELCQNLVHDTDYYVDKLKTIVKK